MRVLVVTPTPTAPATQGNRVRVAQVASTFKRAGATVDLLYYALDGFDAAALEAMRNDWDSVMVLHPDGFTPRRSLADRWGIDDWISPQLIQCARGLAASVAYDAVIVNYVWCSAVLDCFPAGPGAPLKIIDTHDAFGSRAERIREAGLTPHWYYTSRTEEGRGLDRADIVLAIQSEEAVYFQSITRAEVRTIEYARPMDPVGPRARRRGCTQSWRIGYIGSANPWNLLSVRRFDQLMVAGRRQFGAEGPPKVLLFGPIAEQVGELNYCLPMGVVGDVRDAYEQVDLVINPMVGGTGLKIKTVEALSYGRPIVSTLAGGIGLEWLHNDLVHPDLLSLIKRLAVLSANDEEFDELKLSMPDAYRCFYTEVDAKMTALIAAAQER